MLGCEPVMKEPSFPCRGRCGTCMQCDFKVTAVKRISLRPSGTWPWMIAFTGIIMNDRRSAWSSRSVWLIVSDEMEDCWRRIRSLRGYYAFNADNMLVQIKAKKTSREILRKDRRKIKLGCGNSKRCGRRRFSCLMSLQSRCQQHHHEQDGEP